MARYVVQLSTYKTIVVNATDEMDAEEKVLARVNKRNDAWVVDEVYAQKEMK